LRLNHPIRTALRRAAMVALFRPIARVMFGLNQIGRENLPTRGPAIIVANHNSHVDTLVLLCIFPSRLIGQLRPVAAADHFLGDPVSSWFSRRVVGIIPLKRTGANRDEDVLAEAKQALKEGDILIVFPEGTRGAPEELGAFKAGVARLAEAAPDAPIVPIYIQGAGRALPKGTAIPVPFDITIVIGQALAFAGSRPELIATLRTKLAALKALAPPLKWE
jgi:1-acyl-sn-glycerol-3-phosphate acyltransferase